MLKKILIGLAVALGLVGCFAIYAIFFSQPDTSEMANLMIQTAMDRKDKAQALQVIETEYVLRQQLPELKRFWTIYIDSCEQGQCLDVTRSSDKPGYGEEAAYAAVRQETEKSLKSPASAKFEEKENLEQKGEPGQLYSFSYYVDAQNAFGAMMRLDCRAVVQNVGERYWYVSNLDCAQR